MRICDIHTRDTSKCGYKSRKAKPDNGRYRLALLSLVLRSARHRGICSNKSSLYLFSFSLSFND